MEVIYLRGSQITSFYRDYEKLASIFNKNIIDKRARKKHPLFASVIYHELLTPPPSLSELPFRQQ